MGIGLFCPLGIRKWELIAFDKKNVVLVDDSGLDINDSTLFTWVLHWVWYPLTFNVF